MSRVPTVSAREELEHVRAQIALLGPGMRAAVDAAVLALRADFGSASETQHTIVMLAIALLLAEDKAKLEPLNA